MLREIAVLLFLVSTLPNLAIGFKRVSPTQEIVCYSTTHTTSTQSCFGVEIGNMTAEECCSTGGNTFTYSNECLGCVLVGFNVTELNFAPDDAGTTALVELEIEKIIRSTFFMLTLSVNSVNFSKNSAEINDSVTNYPRNVKVLIGSTTSETTQNVSLMISSNGNSKALEEPLEFFIEISVLSGAGVVGLIISQPTVRITVADLDVFLIGFLRSQIVVTEGDEVSVTIVQTNDVTGQRRANNFTEKPLIVNDPVTAEGNGIDYSYTDGDVPNMRISATTRRLIPITFKIGSTKSDNILEGREYFVLRVTQSNLLRVGDNSSVSISIHDATAAEVKLQKPVYYTDESSSSLDVCAEIIGKNVTVDLDETMTVSANLMENTAKGGVDYVIEQVEFEFRNQSKTDCQTVSITQDTIREAQENFTITLNPLSGDTSNYLTNLSVNEDPSHIVILDDDRADVYFEQDFATFSEADGDQDIYLRYSGAQPVGNITVEVYDIDTDVEVGQVTFTPSSGNLVSFSLSNPDNNIALEPDRILNLGMRKSPSFDIGTPSKMTIMIVDDDNATITFSNAEYTFMENVGITYQVTVELNREVARDFTVKVSGNTIPLGQGVVDSGSSVNELITFTAYNSSQNNLQQIVKVQIINDSVSGEPNQRYTLALSQQPSGVVVYPYSTTTIIIIDDDSSLVRFEPFMGPLLESAQMYDLTVFLDGEISDHVSVDVLDANGNLVRTVMFEPISGQTTQSKVVTVRFTDDENALEDTETLKFSLSNPNGVNVVPPSTIDVLVSDDDNVTVTFSSISNTFYEYEVSQPIGVQIDKTILKDLEVSVFGESLPTSGVAVSGQLVNETVTFQAQDAMLKTIFINITNDVIAGENDENYKLKFVKSSPSDGIILGPDANVKIIDEDILTYGISGEPNVVYPENGGNQVFKITISPYARSLAFNLTLVLIGPLGFEKSLGSIECGGATNGILQLPPSSTTVEINCIVEVIDDQVTDEDDEIYRFEISLISPDPETISVDSGTTKLNLTIEDDDDTRTCQYSSTTQDISTFGGSNTYQYNRTCEHALLKQMTTIGKLGVFIDSLDGTFMTTRVGVRIGLYESIVVGAYTRTVIRQNSLSHIAFTNTSTKLSISVSSLGLTVEITDSGISVTVAFNSELQKHIGLCGDLNGEFTSRNVDLSNMTSLNRMINRFLTPPSETFIRERRPECGLVREDLETGDPLFVVPLYTPSAAKPHSYSLCYEIHGHKNMTYNFISDECTQVSAHYYETTDPDPAITRPFHGVDEIHITAVNNHQQCVSITVSLKNKVLSTSVGDSLLVGKYLQSGISVRQIANNRTRISVPNCADNRLIMNVFSRNLDTTIPYLEFKVFRGLNLRESSHGLIGQFWNVRTSVTKYTLRDSIVYNDTYLIEMMPRDKPKRSFIGFLYDLTWNFETFPCLYAGNAEGGPIGEVADGDPNGSLIEGTMNDYSTSNFAYDHFDEEKCEIDNVLK